MHWSLPVAKVGLALNGIHIVIELTISGSVELSFEQRNAKYLTFI